MYHNIHYKYYTHTLTEPHHWHSAVLLPGVRDVVRHVAAPRVAHPFDVERGAGLTLRVYRGRGELDAR